MPVKIVEVPDLGRVKLYKRRGTRSIKITITNDDYVRVSLPTWVPYRAGLEFAKSKKAWVAQHKKPSTSFTDKMAIGKSHRLKIIFDQNIHNPSTRITGSEIVVKVSNANSLSTAHARNLIVKAAERALTKEAKTLLPQKLLSLSKRHDISYKELRVKKLKTRWGSCNQQKVITLNIYLMLLPWELIDYVILHELTHTKHLNHSQNFWKFLKSQLPDTERLKKDIKTYQPSF